MSSCLFSNILKMILIVKHTVARSFRFCGRYKGSRLVLILFANLEGSDFVVSILKRVKSGIGLVFLEENVFVEVFTV